MTFRLTRRTMLAGAAASLAAPRLAFAAPIEIEAHYAMPAVYKDVKETIARAFMAANPDVRVAWRQPAASYDEATQLVLREAVTGRQPDLTFQGLNRLRVVAERGLAVDLAPLLKAEGDPAKAGYTPELLGLGQAGGIQAGLAFATSNPIVFINADLFRRAGLDPDRKLTTWDEHIEASKRISALGGGVHGSYYRWQGDWIYSALLFGFGGAMMDAAEREIGFAGPEGRASLSVLDRLVKEGGMPALSGEAGAQAFAAGKVGMYYWSTAFLRQAMNSLGQNFRLATWEFPLGDKARGRLPTGGAAGMILAKDPAKQQAAYRFLRYATGPEGCATMVKGTGYVPVNQIAADDPRFLGDFYRDNPLFMTGVRQMPIMVPWYAFPGANGVRITSVITDNVSRVVEQKAPVDTALADMAREVTRLLPRA
ncbi:MAG: ABC transporter substrate-binding protein [Proteobacteria bacterium]|nr:ABC transporter substrate-binding protein [Pseudomonadota bacterium]